MPQGTPPLQNAGTLFVAVAARQARHSGLICRVGPASAPVPVAVVGVWPAAKCVPMSDTISHVIETIYHRVWIANKFLEKVPAYMTHQALKGLRNLNCWLVFLLLA